MLYAGTGNAGSFKTTDGGQHWQRAGVGMDAQASIRSLVVDPLDSERVFAAEWRTGVYYSENGDQTWALLSTQGPGLER